MEGNYEREYIKFLKKQVEYKDNYIKIEEILNEKEYININNKIETLLKCFDFVNLEMIIYRNSYFTQDMLHILLNKEVSKSSIKNTCENTDFYGRDGRSINMMNLNLIISEIQELIFLLKNSSFEINYLSNHNIRTNKKNYNTDFVYNNKFVEFQSSFKDIDKILIKEAKIKGILELYNNDEKIYLVQQKILKDGNTLYKVVDLRNFEEGDKVLRFVNKPEIEILNIGEWKKIEDLKIGE